MIHLVQNSKIRLRLQFSHLNEHKFRHGISDTINSMCACVTEIETTEHFLLHCQFCSTQRLELSENHEKVDPHFLSFSATNQILILVLVLEPAPKILIKKFLKM